MRFSCSTQKIGFAEAEMQVIITLYRISIQVVLPIRYTQGIASFGTVLVIY